jgi:hypothetical protein|tara:strand:+ start:1342 stop:1554 length:213 start_codon:yes stop_codon:yes gene_type:complete
MENNDNIKNIVDAIAGGNTVAATDSFGQIMKTRQELALDAKRQEMAADLFAKYGGGDTAVSAEEPATEEE